MEQVNHSFKLKGDIGMSHHEKEGEQEDAYIHQNRNSFIAPSLHLCLYLLFVEKGIAGLHLILKVCLHKQT